MKWLIEEHLWKSFLKKSSRKKSSVMSGLLACSTFCICVRFRVGPGKVEQKVKDVRMSEAGRSALAVSIMKNTLVPLFRPVLSSVSSFAKKNKKSRSSRL